MPEWASTLIVVAVLVLIFLGMWLGWRRRARRDAGLAPSHDVPAGLDQPRAEARVLHVATTVHDAPLERLAIPGLGFRAHGRLAVHPEGVRLELAGAADAWIPAADVAGAHPAQVAIDKAVERDGLLVMEWRTAATVVDSYFRVAEPEKSGALYDAITTLTSDGIETPAARAARPADNRESEV